MRIFTFTLAALLSLFLASNAGAQELKDIIKGTWFGLAPDCGNVFVVVSDVDAAGVVKGTFDCVRVGKAPLVEQAVPGKSMRGVVQGRKFLIKGATTTIDLDYEGGGILKGPLKAQGRGDLILTLRKQ